MIIQVSSLKSDLKNTLLGSGEMAQWIKTLAAKAYNLSSSPINHMVTLNCPDLLVCMHVCVSARTHTHTQYIQTHMTQTCTHGEGNPKNIIPINPYHRHTHSPLCKGLPHRGVPGDTTLVINTLVMLSGLSPSGLGGPKSCSPSPFSKLYKKAGFKICCRT